METQTEIAGTVSQNDIEQYVHSNVNPNFSYIILNLIWKESRFKIDAQNGNCIGLTQVNPSFHDISDPYNWQENVSYCTSYIASKTYEYDSPELALMCWNMGEDKAVSSYNNGYISDYARNIMKYANERRVRDK